MKAAHAIENVFHTYACNEYSPRLWGAAREAARSDPRKPSGACCNNEQRGLNGGCANCDEPCL